MNEIAKGAHRPRRIGWKVAAVSVVMFAAGAAAAVGVARTAGWSIWIDSGDPRHDRVVMKGEKGTIILPVNKGDGGRIKDALSNGGKLLELQPRRDADN